MGKLVSLENVEVSYQGKPLLNNINWSLEQGSHYAVIGDIGAGKTVLGKTLCGKMHVTKGRINYHFLSNASDYQERNQQIKMVSFTDSSSIFSGVNADHYYQQRYNAFDADGHLTALDYLRSHGYEDSNTVHFAIVERLDLLPLLSLERIKLSSGQTRKLILTSALIEEPTILWLDNPHVGLDASSRLEFNFLIDQLAEEENITFILSGHFHSLPDCVSSISKLQNGNLSIGTFYPNNNGQFQGKPVSPQLIQYFNEFDYSSTQPIVKMQNVHIAYHESQIMDQFNWEVRQGEKWVVLGPNGSGKSTLLSCIYADHPQVYANNVSLFGIRRGQGESIWEIKSKIGFTSPELHAYFRYNFSAKDLILSGFWDRFVVKRTSDKKLELVKMLLEYFGLLSILNTPYRFLSTGTQRLCFFLRALIKNPLLLLLDEPYQALDEVTIKRCNDLLNQILTPQHTLIFISHFHDHTPKVVSKFLDFAKN